MKGKTIDYELKVAMCADYLLGMSMMELFKKYGGTSANITKWIKARGCFKIRQTRVQRSIK